MATASGAPIIADGSATGRHFLIVEARHHDGLADELLRGASNALEAAGATYDVVTVPGAFEIPAAIAMAFEGQPDEYDGFIALGAILAAETDRADLIARESGRALMDISLEPVALGIGVLVAETEAQAWPLALVNDRDRGGHAARTALAMATLKAQLGA